MYYALAFKFTEMASSVLCGISRLCPGKGAGQGLQKEGHIGKSHSFSVTIIRLQGRHSQWVVHGDAPSRNTLIMGCWHVSRRDLAIGGWEAGVRLSTGQIQKRE